MRKLIWTLCVMVWSLAGFAQEKSYQLYQPHPGHSAGAACGGSENQSVASSARRKDLGAAGGKTDRRERPREGFPGGRHNQPQGHLPPDVSRGALLRAAAAGFVLPVHRSGVRNQGRQALPCANHAFTLRIFYV